MQRRGLLTLPALGLASRVAAAQTSSIDAALARFKALPGDTSCVIEVDKPDVPWRAEHRPDARMFVGSAIKTFILTTYLQEVEAGRLSEDEQLPLDDGVRSLSSPSFLHLTGTTPARVALEQMIAHSDNTATDMALARVGVAKVRAFIAAGGWRDTQIPDSTRRLFSWLAGAAPGVDIGWAGSQAVMDGKLFGTPRSPLNGQQTMTCPAAAFVAYYKFALLGRYFSKLATLVEFRRIQAMADAIPLIVPSDRTAWAKGGSIDWQDFHALCVPGQMLLGRVPVTFCFTLNWTGPDSGVAEMMGGYKNAVAGVLAEVATAFG